MTRAGVTRAGRGLFVALAVALGACGEADDGSAARSLEADARTLATIVASDPAGSVLDDVDDAIDTDRPVLGADLLTELGLPALRRQVTRIEDLSVATSEGRTLRARAVRLYRARVTAYEAYRDLLMRGLVDDVELLDALDAVSENEREILALRRDLVALVPAAPSEEAARADEEPGLAGLPPVAREPTPPDDETPGGEPEGREEDPAVLEDALPEM